MPIGCASVETHRGQIMTGNRSTSARISSNDRLPDPMTTDARNSTTGTPLVSQRLAGLDPALEMLAERLVARREAAEVDDPANPRPPRRFAKIAGGDAIGVAVVAVGPHGVHQVIGHVDARQRAIE